MSLKILEKIVGHWSEYGVSFSGFEGLGKEPFKIWRTMLAKFGTATDIYIKINATHISCYEIETDGGYSPSKRYPLEDPESIQKIQDHLVEYFGRPAMFQARMEIEQIKQELKNEPNT